jgi:ATP-binding cassette subfamily B protein
VETDSKMEHTTETNETTKRADGAPKLSFREHVAWLWAFWRPHRAVLVALALFTLVSASVAVAYPLVFRWVIDRVSGIFEANGEAQGLSQVMLILSAILLGHFIARLYPATRAMVNARLERDIRDKVFGELMTKDYRFNNRFRTGDVVTRLTDDIAEWPKVAWFACSGIFRAVESSSKLIFCLGAMVYLSGRLTLLSILPLPIMMWVFYSLRHRMQYYMEESQKSVSATNEVLESVFTGVRIVKAFGAEEAQATRLRDVLKRRFDVLLGLIKSQVIMWSLDTFASRLGQMIVIAYGGYLVIEGTLTVGTIFAFYVYLDMLTAPMMDIPWLFMTGQQAFVSIDRVEELRRFPVTEERSEGSGLDRVDELAFEGVTFSYDGSREHLNDVSFRAKAGSRVAVVGPVACGKSTVLKLIAGIMSPTDGAVLVNGRRLNETDWETYREKIGYVPQEAVLFSKSVRENVLFGRGVPAEAPESDSAEWTERCLSVAQMDADLKTLPAGLDTVVGQKGTLVSGGQKQRIAIARALAGWPEILLLDDSTAALDARNEDRFWTRLDTEFGGRITFVVSHRLTTIRRADTILVLDEGRLVDQGTHDELVARCDIYQEFLQTERRKEHLEMVAGMRLASDDETMVV